MINIQLRLSLALAVLLAGTAAERALADACGDYVRTGTDYSYRDLTAGNFQGLDLSGANFQGAKLDGALFVNADLTGANFSGASLLPTSVDTPVRFTGADLTNACFGDASMPAARLDMVTLSCTSFSGANLTAALFDLDPDITSDSSCRIDLSHAVVGAAAFPVEDWDLIDFSYADFYGLEPSRPPTLTGADLSDTLIAGINLTGFDLEGTVFDGADLTEADLRSADLRTANFVGATLTRARMDYADATSAAFYDPERGTLHADLTAVTAQQAVFDQADLQGANLPQAVFLGASLNGANLQQAVLEGQGGSPAANFATARLRNADLRNSHLNGVDFRNADLRNADLTGLTLTGTRFDGALLSDAIFSRAILQGVDFGGAALENALFDNSKLSTGANSAPTNFSCAQLGGADFTSATIDGAAFQSAVMPAASDCCPQAGGGSYCGTIVQTGEPYGATTTTTPQTDVVCPNGDYAKCSGGQWQVPGWTTRYCSSAGSSVKIWTPPTPCTTTPPSGDVVDVPDPALAACLSKAIFGESGQDIPVETAAAVTSISCVGQGIADGTGLEAFTALSSLDLSGNALTSAGFLSDMNELNILKLGGNQLTAVALQGLFRLTYVDVSNNRLTQLGGLADVYLTYLDASYNQLRGTLRVATQSELFFLDVSHNQLSSFGGRLDRLKGLTYLDVQNNLFETLGSLAALVPTSGGGSLSLLDVACNPDFDCDSLDLGDSRQGQALLAGSQCGVTSTAVCGTSGGSG